MTLKITYFVHGTTTDNEKGIATGTLPGELSEIGIKQCEELKNQISHKFDEIFCSDQKRALDSAKITFGSAIQDKRLRECNYGDLNGKKGFKDRMKNFIDKPFPNGESYKDFEKRIKEFLDFLEENYQDKHIAIVAHQALQLAIEVLLKGITWEQAIDEDWRKTRNWQPGWDYLLI